MWLDDLGYAAAIIVAVVIGAAVATYFVERWVR